MNKIYYTIFKTDYGNILMQTYSQSLFFWIFPFWIILSYYNVHMQEHL